MQPASTDEGMKPAATAAATGLTTSKLDPNANDRIKPTWSDDDDDESLVDVATDDRNPVEEAPGDALPFHFAGLHTSLLERHNQRRRDAAANATTSTWYPNQYPKMIGSIRDSLNHRTNSTTTTTTSSCSCRRTKCLVLYCACFASANYCASNRCHCVNCGNTSDPSHAMTRHEAVVQAVTRYPNAFRTLCTSDVSPVRPFCGNDRCRCFVTGIHCIPSECTCIVCHSLLKRQKRFYNGKDRINVQVSPSTKKKSSSSSLSKPVAAAASPATTPTTPSASGDGKGGEVDTPVRLKIDGKVVPGLSFARATSSSIPVSSSTTTPTTGDASTNNNGPKFVVHDLMLAPSKVVVTPPPAPPPPPIVAPAPPLNYPHSASFRMDPALTRGTEVEQHWHRETHDLRTFLSLLQAELRSQLPAQGYNNILPPTSTTTPHSVSAPTSAAAPTTTGSSDMERHAKLVLSSIEHDLIAVHKVAQAAELDVLTRLSGQRRSSSTLAHGTSPITSPSKEEKRSTEAKRKMQRQASKRGTSSQPRAITTSSASAATATLLCHEVLPEHLAAEADVVASTASSQHHPTTTSQEMRQAIVAAARDAAMFRETARILKRKARELCEHRLRRQQQQGNTTTTASTLLSSPSAKAW